MAAFLCAFVVSLAVLRYVLPGVSRVVKGPYLDATLEDARLEARQTSRVTAGENGVAVTFLHPAGKVQIGEDIYDTITEGEFLEKGTPVVVAAIRGNRIVVRRQTEGGT